MADFCQFLTFFKECTNTGPTHVWDGWKECKSARVATVILKQGGRITQMVEFRVAMTFRFTHNGLIFFKECINIGPGVGGKSTRDWVG